METTCDPPANGRPVEQGSAARGSAGGVQTDQAARLRSMLGSGSQEDRAADVREPAADTRRATVIAIGSGKGGVGKTCISVNLAAVLAQRGLRVCLVDLDLGAANADVLCNVRPRARLDRVLDDVSRIGNDAFASLVHPTPYGFGLIPGSAGRPAMTDMGARGRMLLASGLRELDRCADVVLLDLMPGVGPVVRAMLKSADVPIVVTTSEPPAMADAYGLIKCLSQAGADASSVRLVINRAAGAADAQSAAKRIQSVGARFLASSPRLSGWIREDIAMIEAVRARGLILDRSPRSPAARDVRRLGAEVAREVRSHSGGSRPRRRWRGFFRVIGFKSVSVRDLQHR